MSRSSRATVEFVSLHLCCCFNLILTPLTRAGSRQIPEDCGSLILKILLLENHDLNFTKTYFLERNL